MSRLVGKIRPMLWFAVGLSAVLLPTNVADFVIENGQIAVIDPNGITSQSSDFSTKKTSSPTPELKLNDETTLKVTFDLLTQSSSGEGTESAVPRQVNLLATGLDTKLHWATVVKVRGTGKAKWELDLARAPTDFLSISRTGEILLELVIGDFEPKHAPLRLKLSTLNVSKDLLLEYPYWDTKDGKPPSALELEKYYVQPVLKWTFRPPRKKENPILSVVFTGIVLSPWLVLLTTWSKLSSRSTPTFKLLSSPTSSTVLFILTLISQEVMILTYWTSLRLYQYLPIAFLLSLPLILSGREALSELRARRKKNPLSASHIIPAHLFDDKGKQKAE